MDVILAGERPDVDLALIPAEAINDSGLFMDDLSLESLINQAPVEIRPSYWFVDALSERPTPVAVVRPREFS